MIAAIIGEYADSYLGWFTMESTAGFFSLLTLRGTSSFDSAMNSFCELIFLKALARVLFTPAVCFSDSIPFKKALAILWEVKSDFRKATSFLVLSDWNRAMMWGRVQNWG